jgi:hypothetical protein
MVNPGGIASGDLGLLLFSAVHQNLFNDLVSGCLRDIAGRALCTDRSFGGEAWTVWEASRS